MERLENEILLNQLSQNVLSVEEGLSWFSGLSSLQQSEVFRHLCHLILQSGAAGVDIEEAILSSGLKPTFTPCVLLKQALINDPLGSMGLRNSLAKITALPSSERIKSFALLVSLFSVSDKRKREKGVFPERYWWHRDLSNPDVIESIKNSYTS